MFKRLAMAFCGLLLLAAIPVAADQGDKKTTVTFSQPFEIPGMALPAGTYVFKLLNSSNDRNIVLVYNEEQNHLYAMILAINNYRLNRTSDSVFKFGEERTQGAPQVLRAWFWPGDNWGQEFVYPQAKAKELAETAKVPVLTAQVTPAEKPEELIEAPVVAITPENREVEIAEVTPVEAPAPELIAEAPPELAVAPTPVPELPKTASPIPLIALIGLGSLGLAGVLRTLAR